MNNMDLQDQDILILQNIRKNTEKVKQRDLARIMGISLGMTNAILKRLVKMGLLIIKKINSRTVRYAVSSSGINAITRKSTHYLKRTIRNVVIYKEILEKQVLEIIRNGFKAVVLLGKSDFDFIIEHLCQKHRIEFIRSEAEEHNPCHYYVYSENYSGDCVEDPGKCINLGAFLASEDAGMAENEDESCHQQEN
jgi:predicted transcriptional regulator